MLTSFADDEALYASIMAGAAGYVLKQIRGGDLVRGIRAVGAGQSLLDPAVTRGVLERLRRGKHLLKDEKLALLSAQEERILALVAEGKTNGQIGDELHLAEKTVKNYVSSILGKLEVARRAEAAAYLARHTTTPGSTDAPSIPVPALDPASLRWAVNAAAPGADVTGVRGLRDGGSPWLVQLTRHGKDRSTVLRVGTSQDPAGARHRGGGTPAGRRPRHPGASAAGRRPGRRPAPGPGRALPGSSRIPPGRPSARLRILGRAAAALHAVSLKPASALPQRDRPIASVDFAALRRQHPPYPLLVEAEQRVGDPPPRDPAVFVHGDLWQGNALWTGDTLNGLIDWDCAGSGSPGIDLGSLRCDAAICFGLEAAADIQQGWEEVAARPADDVADWMSSPPSAPRPTWAGSPPRSPARAAPTSPRTSCSGVATGSSRPPSPGWTPGSASIFHVFPYRWYTDVSPLLTTLAEPLISFGQHLPASGVAAAELPGGEGQHDRGVEGEQAEPGPGRECHQSGCTLATAAPAGTGRYG